MIINPYSFGVALDTDAQEFLTAVGITDSTISGATNTLVTTMKSDGIWTKMKAIYPMVGGSASTHKWNLKDPRDLDAAFRLQFFGGWTHSANGAQPNGSNGYADTFLSPLSHLSINSTHISFYSKTEADNLGCSIANGYGGNFANQINLFLKFSNDSYCRVNSSSSGGITNISSLGLHIANRISSSETRNRIRGQLKIQTNTSTGLSAHSIVLSGARFELNTAISAYDNRMCAFASIGDGLTDTEADNFSTAVQEFQTTLNRQV